MWETHPPGMAACCLDYYFHTWGKPKYLGRYARAWQKLPRHTNTLFCGATRHPVLRRKKGKRSRSASNILLKRSPASYLLRWREPATATERTTVSCRPWRKLAFQST